MKERFSRFWSIVAKITEEKYKPLIISALEGMLAGSLLFLLFVSITEEVLAAILFGLLTPILPSALVLHLSYTLPKKFAHSWQKDKTIVACLTSVLLIYAYTILLLSLLTDISRGSILTEEVLLFPIYVFFPLSFLIYGPMIFALIPAIAVAFIATKGIGNKCARIIFVFLLACLIFSMSVFPFLFCYGT
jgi:hypothetical protein